MYHVVVQYRAVPWNRPAGRSIRYDSQITEKAALSALIRRSLLDTYFSGGTRMPDVPLFPKDKMVELIATFVFKDERKGKGGLVYPLKDVDNLMKFLQDTLQSQFLEGFLWSDDKQVTRIIAEKCYGAEDKIFLTITELELRKPDASTNTTSA